MANFPGLRYLFFLLLVIRELTVIDSANAYKPDPLALMKRTAQKVSIWQDMEN